MLSMFVGTLLAYSITHPVFGLDFPAAVNVSTVGLIISKRIKLGYYLLLFFFFIVSPYSLAF
ncbi:MAG TPA: hypothetical protein VJZ75_06525 [Candidatus Bathyarchaeia archaeon]|nr:hypothetical protein [Candidatus Bathyarchaeia archaeon]